MTKNLLRIILACLIIVSISGWTSFSWAVMKALSIADLTTKSDLVIVGQVANLGSEWSSDGGEIITKATVKIDEKLKENKVTEGIISVEYLGGEVDGIGLKISDMPLLERGEQVVLFLTTSELKGIAKRAGRKDKSQILPVFKIFGLAQGKYSVGADKIATKRGFSVVDNFETTESRIPLWKLKEKILEAQHE